MTWPLAMSTSLLWPAPLAECLARLAEAGFSAAEITPSHIFRDLASNQAAAAVAAGLRDRDLVIVTVHLPFGSDYDLAHESEWRFQQAFAHLLQVAEVAHTLGAQALILHPSDTERRQVPSVSGALPRIRRRVEAFLPVCRHLHLTLALEHMLPHLLGGRVEELRAIADPLLDPGLCFCLDVSHASFAGHLPSTIAGLADRLRYLHASDNRGQHDDHLLPGRGVLPWPEIVSTLTRVGFAGTIVVEPAPMTFIPTSLADLRAELSDRLQAIGRADNERA